MVPMRPVQTVTAHRQPYHLDDSALVPGYVGGPTLDGFRAAVGRTPLVRIGADVDGRQRDIYLKLELANPCGSLKDRTALSLVDSIGLDRLRREEVTLVESTSGNLGIALAVIARLAGIRVVAVVDPKTPLRMLHELRARAARLEMVSTPDPSGCYLHARIRRVTELCESIPNAVWVNQYSNPANPAAHLLGTAPEVDRQMDGDVDAIFVAVSTGGTLSGVARYFRAKRASTRIIAVDTVGSIVFGNASHWQRLTGIGSSRKSDFIQPWHYDQVALVTDSQAFAFCRALAAATGMALGGSSGAVLAACCHYLATHPEVRRPVCIAADGGARYGNTIYDDRWIGQEELALEAALLASPVSGRRFEFFATDELRACP